MPSMPTLTQGSRHETDSLGRRAVPAEAYCGIQRDGRSIGEVALERRLVTAEELAGLLEPGLLVRPQGAEGELRKAGGTTAMVLG